MAFNIQDFKVSTEMGFLKPSNFIVYIYPPKWVTRKGIEPPDLAYLAAAASLPGIQILTQESKIYGQGPTVKMAYDIATTDITLKFYADGDGDSLAYFYDWLRNIVNLSHTQDQVRLYVLRARLPTMSMAAAKSAAVKFATVLSVNGSTMIPFLNRGKPVLSRIDKSCLLTVACSINDRDV